MATPNNPPSLEELSVITTETAELQQLSESIEYRLSREEISCCLSLTFDVDCQDEVDLSMNLPLNITFLQKLNELIKAEIQLRKNTYKLVFDDETLSQKLKKWGNKIFGNNSDPNP